MIAASAFGANGISRYGTGGALPLAAIPSEHPF
jgi:hypothetical protein